MPGSCLEPYAGCWAGPLKAGHFAKVIDRLAQDLRTAFPDMKGFSPRNLK
jgi:hypothetical protein